MQNFFIQGIIVGFAIAAPVGPISILCIARCVQYGFWSGLSSGLGAALADAIYAMIAGFGFTILKQGLLDHQHIFKFFGGIFLIYLGLRTMRKTTHKSNHAATCPSTFSSFITTFLLTIASPMTILAFTALFASIDITPTTLSQGWWFIVGVFLGSTLWWCMLCGVVSMVRERISQHSFSIINTISGLTICLFGVYALISALRW